VLTSRLASVANVAVAVAALASAATACGGASDGRPRASPEESVERAVRAHVDQGDYRKALGDVDIEAVNCRRGERMFEGVPVYACSVEFEGGAVRDMAVAQARDGRLYTDADTPELSRKLPF
jgi:hypothetical protein